MKLARDPKACSRQSVRRVCGAYNQDLFHGHIVFGKFFCIPCNRFSKQGQALRGCKAERHACLQRSAAQETELSAR